MAAFVSGVSAVPQELLTYVVWFVILILLGLLISLPGWFIKRVRSRRLLAPLCQLIDERSGNIQSHALRGHFQGRDVAFYISQQKPSEFKTALACRPPLLFAVRRKELGLFTSSELPAGKQFLIGDSALDENFYFSDVIGSGWLSKALRLRPVSGTEESRNLEQAGTWLRIPEIKNRMLSLFDSLGMDSLSANYDLPPGAKLPQAYVTAGYYGYRKSDVEVNRVRKVLEDLEFLARSLESQPGPPFTSLTG